jgi:hypothetical protein
MRRQAGAERSKEYAIERYTDVKRSAGEDKGVLRLGRFEGRTTVRTLRSEIQGKKIDT